MSKEKITFFSHFAIILLVEQEGLHDMIEAVKETLGESVTFIVIEPPGFNWSSYTTPNSCSALCQNALI